MVNKSNSKKSVKEITVEKPKEETVISTPPAQTDNEPSFKIKDLNKLKSSIVSELTPKRELYESDTSKPRKKRAKKSSIKRGQEIKESPVTLEKIDKPIGFYFGIFVGILAGTLGIYYLYLKIKDRKPNQIKSDEDLYEELKREGLTKIEDVKKYT
jgi:hypothetical protein